MWKWLLSPFPFSHTTEKYDQKSLRAGLSFPSSCSSCLKQGGVSTRWSREHARAVSLEAVSCINNQLTTLPTRSALWRISWLLIEAWLDVSSRRFVCLPNPCGWRLDASFAASEKNKNNSVSVCGDGWDRRDKRFGSTAPLRVRCLRFDCWISLLLFVWMDAWGVTCHM